MLTDKEIAKAVARHQPMQWVGAPCQACHDDWPCDAHKALTDLKTARAALRLSKHKAEQLLAGECAPEQRLKAIIQIAHAILEGGE